MGNATKKESINYLKKQINITKIFYVIIFFLIIFYRPVSLTYEQKDKFLAGGYHTQYENYKRAYYSSQYVVKKNPSIIPDEIFEAFAGGAFLRGLNPILITHDHPPLGRYIISLSILLFDNANTIMLPLFLLAIGGIFLIGYEIFGNVFLSLIPVGIFINEPLFMDKIIYTPLPEPIQLPFILFSFYFFIKAIESKKYIYWYIATSIMIGIIISTRFFITGAVISCSMIIFMLLKNRLGKKTFIFISTLPLSLIVLLLSYTRTIQSGSSILHIFGIQRYILEYHKSKFILPFTFWDLLFFNRWHTWWGNWAIISDNQWFILWPVATIVSFIAFISHIIKKIRLYDAEFFLCIWFFLQVIVFSTGYTSTRYFLPFLPILYILAVSLLYKLVNKYVLKRIR